MRMSGACVAPSASAGAWVCWVQLGCGRAARRPASRPRLLTRRILGAGTHAGRAWQSMASSRPSCSSTPHSFPVNCAPFSYAQPFLSPTDTSAHRLPSAWNTRLPDLLLSISHLIFHPLPISFHIAISNTDASRSVPCLHRHPPGYTQLSDIALAHSPCQQVSSVPPVSHRPTRPTRAE
jgi:hypothetical protein